MLQISANWCKWRKFVLMIRAHDANGSANWCTLRKLVQMAEIGANGAHDAVGSANWGKC